MVISSRELRGQPALGGGRSSRVAFYSQPAILNPLPAIIEDPLRGYLAHKKTPIPLGPYGRVLQGGVFLWARYPCSFFSPPPLATLARILEFKQQQPVEKRAHVFGGWVQGYLACKKTQPPRTLP